MKHASSYFHESLLCAHKPYQHIHACTAHFLRQVYGCAIPLILSLQSPCFKRNASSREPPKRPLKIAVNSTTLASYSHAHNSCWPSLTQVKFLHPLNQHKSPKSTSGSQRVFYIRVHVMCGTLSAPRRMLTSCGTVNTRIPTKLRGVTFL